MNSSIRGTPIPLFGTAVALACLSVSPSNAGSTDLADVPMAVKTHAKPNVLFVYDDSGSMDFEVLLDTNDGAAWYNTTSGQSGFTGWNSSDSYVGGTVLNFNRGASTSSTWKKYVYLFPNGASSSDGRRNYADGTNDHFAIPPVNEFAYFRSADYNPLYYDTNTTYSPWAPSNDGTATTTWANITATAAPTHPAKSTTANALNLTVNFQAGSGGWNTADWTFRVQQGMTWTIPAGTICTNVSTSAVATCDSPASAEYNAAIPYYPATFYVKDATCTGADAACQQFGPDGATRLRKYEIKSGNTFPSGRSYADEIQNFANWFSYYRKRRLMMNAAMGGALIGTQGMNGGIFYYNDATPAAMTMYDFNSTTDSGNAKRLLGRLYGKDTSGSTPTKRALENAAAVFNLNPGPIQYACQFNSAFMITDGYDNGTAPATNPGNYDSTSTYGGAAPYQDAYSNTLADVAMKYYTERLRTDLAAGKVPVDTTSTVKGADINNNLHMNTHAMGLGVKGTIYGVNTTATNDPYNTTFVWPDVLSSNKIPESIDDLWHATINGRGKMLSASSPADARAAIMNVLSAIIGDGSAAAVAVANANVTSSGGDNASYVTSYDSGSWTGDLIAYPIDTTTGVPDINNPIWNTGCANPNAYVDSNNPGKGKKGCSAQVKLDSATISSRMIATLKDESNVRTPVLFRPTTAGTTTKLSTTQQALLNSTTTPPGTSDGANVANFIRGDDSKEGTDYRDRIHLLGDLINSEPAVQRQPSASYADTCYGAAVTGKCAASFKDAKASRTRMVYVGGNDGMLHAINATNGVEEWAYVPRFVMAKLNNLSKKVGFSHQYTVDGTPVIGDVDFSETNGVSGNPDPDWRTILVGGLGKGGRGYYALDVTCPKGTTTATATACGTTLTEDNVAAKVLWEFPSSDSSHTSQVDNVGYSFGKPIITKTAAYGWVVLVTSGYNNGSDTGGTGHGYLYVLNAKTGALLKTIDTGVGSSADPSGLAHIAAYANNADIDNTTTYVYGGDLKGNVWRFDLTDSSGTINYTATKLAVLADTNNASQPITSVPELASASINGTEKRFVYVGTGKYMGDTDVSTNQTQTMYGLVDDIAVTTGPVIPSPTRDHLQQQTLTTNIGGTTRTLSTNTVAWNTMSGWYIDLPGCDVGNCTSGSERINTDPALALGALIFTSNIPSTDACTPGGSSWLNVVDYKTGGVLSGSTATWSSTYLGQALASRPVIIKLPSGAVKVLVRLSDATTTTIDPQLPSSATGTSRISWREVIQD